jgi:hypothetical protein
MRSMMSAAPVLEFPDKGGIPRSLWRASAFANHHPQFGTYDALRKRIERRDVNGLEVSGALVETRLGFLIDRDRYIEWLLTPTPRNVAQESRVA